MKNYFRPIIFTIILLIIASIANAAMDITLFHYNKSVFSRMGNDNYYNPQKSWVNKWKIDATGKVLVGQERFPGSSTIFVKFTDFWHLAKSGMIFFIILAIICYRRYGDKLHMILGDFIILYATFTGSFTLFYDYIFAL